MLSVFDFFLCFLCLFVARFSFTSLWLKTERPVLDRPLKVGGGIQPRLVTVLTPATTFTVGEDFIQNCRAVNRAGVIIYKFYRVSNPLSLVRADQECVFN